jgi:hypothetical protein
MTRCPASTLGVSPKVVDDVAGNDQSKVAAFAIVRFDLFLGPDAPLGEMVAVKEVLPSLEEAEAEVARLNAIVDPSRVIYYVQPTRYYPHGRGLADGPGGL